MKKTAVFGGSFDPVHIEHINIAKACVKELGIERLIVLPTENPPHKRAAETRRSTETITLYYKALFIFLKDNLYGRNKTIQA